MGVKNLWAVLTPHAERKPICELRGKRVAVDLAGWICESLNVVDYFVHPRHHLKNLFFRTCYLIWEEVTPVFVLEGTAPKLKSQIIAKRVEVQFRGTNPIQNNKKVSNSTQSTAKGRTRFNHVLKQCENLLQSMGIQCIQAPGEAEAYCAFLNKNGLVDGVISQDSDCFAYGAVCVYRNFSVSTQGAQAAQGGAVDIYNMQKISEKMDFGQQKTIVMALLCGCDYCPDGIGGIGRDGILKLFNIYKETEILEKIRSWRREDNKYTALELRVDDKTLCSNCGHMGRTQSHTKSGCGICRTNRGCDESLWKEKRLSLKAELTLRKKALLDPSFPSEEIISEYLNEPAMLPQLNLVWRQPNIVKFIKQLGHLLQWPEIYSFQKFLPLLTRWQVKNMPRIIETNALTYLTIKEILKKRTVRGVVSLEIVWKDEKGFFNNLIPHQQLQEFEAESSKGLIALWSTIEPLCLVKDAYPSLVADFMKSKEKPAKVVKGRRKRKTSENPVLGSLENLNELIVATEEVAKSMKSKPKRTNKKGLQMIDKFFKLQKTTSPNIPAEYHTPIRRKQRTRSIAQCSTPITQSLPSDLESDCDELAQNISDIVNGIVMCPDPLMRIAKHEGRSLYYEPITNNLSVLLNECSIKDDLDLLTEKRCLSICNQQETSNYPAAKRISLDDSFDVLVNAKRHKLQNLSEKAKEFNLCTTKASLSIKTPLDRFRERNRLNLSIGSDDHRIQLKSDEIKEKEDVLNVSYFFDCSMHENDEFEKLMDMSIANKSSPRDSSENDLANADIILISGSSDEC